MNRLFIRSTMIVVGAGLVAVLSPLLVIVMVAALRQPDDRLINRIEGTSFLAAAILACLGITLLGLAISLLLAWPMLALFLGVIPQAAEVLAWLDVNAVVALVDGIEPIELARVATGAAVWVILPATAGVLRELNREVR